MIIVFLALWIIAAILLFKDFKSRTARWAGAIAFFAGFGGLGVVLESYLPVLIDSPFKTNLIIAIELMYTLSHQVAPYCVLMYGIVQSEIFKKDSFFDRQSFTILSLPVAFMYAIYPIYPKYSPSFIVLSLWVVPYVTIANILLIYSYKREQRIILKREKLFACLVVTPATMFAIVVNYIYKIFGIDKLWYYNSITVSLAFAIFIYAGLKYGIMGIKLKQEKKQASSSFKAMSSGTSMLNHMIKNEIIKIDICASNIKSAMENPLGSEGSINESLEYILESTSFMKDMVNKIQEHTEEIKIVEEYSKIIDVINKAIDMTRLYINHKRIKVDVQCGEHVYIKWDKIHMQEVFRNIIMNSVEAMQPEGQLLIHCGFDKRIIVFTITDNGCGIPTENLPNVKTPFFSTKKSGKNFGLGLSYCANIVAQHGGTLNVHSKNHQGTTVEIILRWRKDRLNDIY